MPSGRVDQARATSSRAMNGTTIEVDQHRRRGPPRARRLPRATRSSAAPSGSSTSRRSPARSSSRSARRSPACSQRRRAGPARSTTPASATGELVWRLPLHAEYGELIKGHVRRHHEHRAGPQGRARSPPRSSSSASSATRRGRTSTSPGVGRRPGQALRGQGRQRLGRAAPRRARDAGGGRNLRLTPLLGGVRQTRHVDGFLDDGIAELAARQHGVIAFVAVTRARRRAERWRRARRGTAPTSPRRVRGRTHMCVGERPVVGGDPGLRRPGAAVLSHRSAASVWDLIQAPSTIEITDPRPEPVDEAHQGASTQARRDDHPRRLPGHHRRPDPPRPRRHPDATTRNEEDMRPRVRYVASSSMPERTKALIEKNDKAPRRGPPPPGRSRIWRRSEPQITESRPRGATPRAGRRETCPSPRSTQPSTASKSTSSWRRPETHSRDRRRRHPPHTDGVRARPPARPDPRPSPAPASSASRGGRSSTSRDASRQALRELLSAARWTSTSPTTTS